MKKIVVGLTVVVLIAGGAVILWRIKTAGSSAKALGTEPSVVTVKRASIRQVVRSTGRVVSKLDVDMKCKASGQVVKLPFDISDHVNSGDLLVEIDPIDQIRGVQQAEADLAISQAKLAQAKANLNVAEKTLQSERLRTDAALKGADARVTDSSAKAKREKDLLEHKQSSIEETETAVTAATQAAQDRQTAQAQIEATKALELQLEVKREDIKLCEAQVNSDQVALDVANQRLKETKVVAPIDGVVAARTIQIGTIIASGVSNVGGGTTVLTLSDLSHIFTYASVDESDIGSVAVDQPVEITADSFPNKLFTGKVVRIATKGVNVTNVVTFEVRVEVLSENKSLLKPEMTTNVEIITAEKDDVLTVPVAAIRRTRNETFVTMKHDDGTTDEKTPVQVGISDGTLTEIESGLNEGDEVLASRSGESRWKTSADQKRTPPMMFGVPGGGRRR